MKIILIIGPMFSGKTTRLIAEIEKHIISGKKCLTIRHTIDTRSKKDILQTHGGMEFKKCKIIQTDMLVPLFDSDIKDMNILAIDEGQFFDKKDLVSFIESCHNIHTIEKMYISALNGDYKKLPFETISQILPLCDKIIKLNSICACGKRATFSKRITKEKNKILIGGEDIYKASCYECYNLK